MIQIYVDNHDWRESNKAALGEVYECISYRRELGSYRRAELYIHGGCLRRHGGCSRRQTPESSVTQL